MLQMRYYQSGGWKLNPNLYERGNICLSLLNTWQGRKSEVWNPKSSSIFQVLLSLQGLVLNAKPYYKSLEKLTAKLFPALSLLGASDQWLSRLHRRWLQRDGEEYIDIDSGKLKPDEEHKLHMIIQCVSFSLFSNKKCCTFALFLVCICLCFEFALLVILCVLSSFYIRT